MIPAPRRCDGFAGKIAAVPELRATLHRKTLEENGRKQLSLTHPDSRVMKIAKGAAVGYNIQIAVEPKRNLIAGKQVPGKVSDVAGGVTPHVTKPVDRTRGLPNTLV